MTQRSPPPDETDKLCESCGYILNGLDPALISTAACPECGAPIAESLEPGRRQPAPIERAWTARAFWQTTHSAILSKRAFYRRLLTRTDTPAVARFGRTHRLAAAVLFGVAGAFHAAWLAEMRGWIRRWTLTDVAMVAGTAVVFIAIAIPALAGLTRLAAFLTTTEGRFWGMRLPSFAVRRAMNFHAANYLPIALCAFAVTAGYRLGLATGWLSPATGVSYLITLCVTVVLGAIWLFDSYVTAMRRIRLANF